MSAPAAPSAVSVFVFERGTARGAQSRWTTLATACTFMREMCTARASGPGPSKFRLSLRSF